MIDISVMGQYVTNWIQTYANIQNAFFPHWIVFHYLKKKGMKSLAN